jgi:octaprenyl-diphosphate synthase
MKDSMADGDFLSRLRPKPADEFAASSRERVNWFTSMNLDKVGQAITVRELFELIQEDLQLVESEIRLESIASVAVVTEIGRYLQASGGKRLRPALLLLSSRLVGNGGHSAIRLAAVVEIIHAATLVHDDVIDRADTRRGRPSTNAQWGNHTSVLAGDWLYMQAFQIALRERNFHMLDLLIGLTQMMVEGELLQLDRIGRIDISEADCMELVHRKTACLFSVCARLGALVSGASTDVEERLGEYAWNLGMAFQLVDDLLDFTAREQVLGKPVGNDLREGKVTLPLVYALEQATAPERARIETVLRDRSYDAVQFEEVLRILERRKGVGRVKERALAFTEKARSIIGEFPESPYQRALLALTDLVTDRDH